jgi:hypothetical protein
LASAGSFEDAVRSLGVGELQGLEVGVRVSQTAIRTVTGPVRKRRGGLTNSGWPPGGLRRQDGDRFCLLCPPRVASRGVPSLASRRHGASCRWGGAEEELRLIMPVTR